MQSIGLNCGVKLLFPHCGPADSALKTDEGHTKQLFMQFSGFFVLHFTTSGILLIGPVDDLDFKILWSRIMSWLEKPVKGLLLDISGVLRDGDQAIKGSIEAFHQLQQSSIPFRLVTNETQVTVDKSVEKLTNLGFEGIKREDIFAPAPAVARHLRETKLRPYLLVHQNVLKEFEGIETSDPNCVVVGDAAQYFTYERLNEAFRVLIQERDNNKPMNLFSLGKGKYYKEEDGLTLDLGPFTVGLEYATGATAQIFGKPNSTYFLTAVQHLGLSPDEVVMIGDDIVGDVGGAQGAGLRGVLVRTGKFRPSDENHEIVKPDGIVDNLAQAILQLL